MGVCRGQTPTQRGMLCPMSLRGPMPSMGPSSLIRLQNAAVVSALRQNWQTDTGISGGIFRINGWLLMVKRV